MSNEDLYHEIACATTDTWMLHKEHQEREEYIAYMKTRTEELSSVECYNCKTIGLEPISMFESHCNNCNTTFKI